MMEPMPEDWERAVAVVAHPDDLEYGAAAAVARWTGQGKYVAYVLATEGEAGIEGMAPDVVGPLRVEEERRSAALVGVTDVDFLGSAASYDLFVAAAQGGVTEGLYAMGLTDMPYRDTLGPAAQAWFDRYKERYKNDPNIGAIYGHVAADLTALGLEKAGADLTLNSFVKGLESIRGYRDIFNGPEANFGPDKHQGANSSFLAVVKGGRWVRLTDPLGF